MVVGLEGVGKPAFRHFFFGSCLAIVGATIVSMCVDLASNYTNHALVLFWMLYTRRKRDNRATPIFLELESRAFFLHVLPFYLVAFFDYHLWVSEGESVEQICSCESQTGDFGVVESSTADDVRSEKDMNGERGCERSVSRREVSVVRVEGKRLRRRGKVARDEAMRRGSWGAWAMRGESMGPVIKGERRVWWPERRILACSSLG